ncbi:MAG: hypothetical protein IKP32_08675 [Clostridia bacterium]|nr:hypothetical protein [Clostridia bacterium]
MISQAQVMMVLEPWLGARLTQALMPMMADIASRLNAYSPRQEISALAQEIDSLLFRAVHQATRGQMLIQLPEGDWVRIRVEDFSVMADELLLPVFEEFPVDSAHLNLLRSYSMGHASLSVLRALYTRFAPLQADAELDAIASVAKNCYPPFRWRQWLR